MRNKYSLKKLLNESEMEQMQFEFMEDEELENMDGMTRVEILDDLLKDPGGDVFKSDEEPITHDLPSGSGQVIKVPLEDGTVAHYEHAPQSFDQLQFDFMNDEEDGLDHDIVIPDPTERGY